MQLSVLLVTIAAATAAASAAKAASVTVNFPAAGDGWCGTFGGVGTCGTLSGYSGNMQAENDFVTSSASNAAAYPIPAHFVATGFSGTLNISSTSAYTVIDFFYPGSPYQLTLANDVGAYPFPFSFTFSTPTPIYPDSPFTVLLGNNIPQTNPTSGNWIQIGTGSLTFAGSVPEPPTWAMMLAGFAGLGFAGYRTAPRAQKSASA